MPAKKRPAAAPAAASPAGKRASLGGDPVAKKCSAVVRALRAAKEELPASAIEMLSVALPSSLAAFEDKRHPHQTQVVAWAAEVLALIESGMQRAVAEGGTAVAAAGEQHAAAQKSLEAKEAEVIAAQEALGKNKEMADAATAGLKEAKAALSAAEVVQTKGDKELAAAAGKKEAIEACQRDTFQPLVEGTASGAKKVNAVLAIGKKFDVDEGHLEALARTLKKEVAARASFDVVVLEQFKLALEGLVASLQKALEEGQPGKDARAADVAAAQQKVDAATEAAAAADSTHQAASEELAARQAERESLAEEFEGRGAAAQNAGEAAERASAALAAFLEGPMASFVELRSRTSPPPPPVEEPMEEAAEEAAEAPKAAAGEAAPAVEAPIEAAAQEA